MAVPQTITDRILKASIEKLNRGQLVVTQGLRSYPLVEMLFGGAQKRFYSHAYRTTVNLDMAAPPQDLIKYGPITYTISDPVRYWLTSVNRFSVPWVLDSMELEENKAGPEQIYDLMDNELNMVHERSRDTLERRIAETPKSGSGQMRGLWYWLRGCSAGVTDTVGGYNGTTVYFEDGSTSTIVGDGGPDAAMAGEMGRRLRSWCATHRGEYNDLTHETLRNALVNTHFQYMPILKGIKPNTTMGATRIICGTTMANSMAKYVEDGPDDNMGEAFKFGSLAKIRGVYVQDVPALDDDAYSPIFGVRIGNGALTGIQLGKYFEYKHPFRVDQYNGNILRSQCDTAVNVAGGPPSTCGFVLHTPRAA